MHCSGARAEWKKQKYLCAGSLMVRLYDKSSCRREQKLVCQWKGWKIPPGSCDFMSWVVEMTFNEMIWTWLRRWPWIAGHGIARTNVFVQIAKCICPNCKSMFVWITKCNTTSMHKQIPNFGPPIHVLPFHRWQNHKSWNKIEPESLKTFFDYSDVILKYGFHAKRVQIFVCQLWTCVCFAKWMKACYL